MVDYEKLLINEITRSLTDNAFYHVNLVIDNNLSKYWLSFNQIKYVVENYRYHKIFTSIVKTEKTEKIEQSDYRYVSCIGYTNGHKVGEKGYKYFIVVDVE